MPSAAEDAAINVLALQWLHASSGQFWLSPSAKLLMQVAKFERPVSLKALSEHPAWQKSDVWNAERMLVPVSEEQWDAVIDILPQ
jgi:predicted RNA-binding protein with PUA-like domain